MRQPYVFVDREQFVTERYKRFLDKKPILIQMEEKGLPVYFTDLDRDYGDGLMKNIVICDRCNENIKDQQFIMFEMERCYHHKCVLDDLPIDFDGGIKNVVFADFGGNIRSEEQ